MRMPHCNSVAANLAYGRMDSIQPLRGISLGCSLFPDEFAPIGRWSSDADRREMGCIQHARLGGIFTKHSSPVIFTRRFHLLPRPSTIPAPRFSANTHEV